MGNQATGGSGGVDVTKQYEVDNVPVDSAEEYGGFSILRGKRKRDRLPVLVFRCEKSKTTSAGLCSNALRQAKKLRHPFILNLLDGTETDTDVFMVTEEATPLVCCLNDLKNDSQKSWGIRCISTALSFLNEKCRLVHGNVTPWTIFVTPGGDWKLFGLELIDTESEGAEKGGGGQVLPPLLRQAQWIPPAQYKSPERRVNDWKSMEASPFWSIDAWSFGCVILDVFEGKSRPQNSSRPRTDVLADVETLSPPALRSNLKQILSSDPKTRLIPSSLLRNDYFSDVFVKSMVFLEELQLKAPEKREAFFKSLVKSAPSFPSGALHYKVIPLLLQAISYECKAVNVANQAVATGQPPPSPASVNTLLCMLDALLVVHSKVKESTTTTRTNLDSAITDLFACNDRIVRIGLLQRIEKIAPVASPETINGCFDQVCTGFSDSTPLVRELTIKAMIHLVPQLNEANKNDKLIRFLAKLQSDPEQAIRTNCVVCLGLISTHLSPDARRKTLAASFARAMKDPFVHARIAGLKGLMNSHKLMALDADTLATKIIPTICPLLVDPVKDVRSIALDTMNSLMKTLQDELKAREAAQASKEATSASALSGANVNEKQSEGFLGMAVNFATSFSKSTPTPPPTATNTPFQAKPMETAKPATIKAKSPAKNEVNWESDDEGNLMGDEVDPDDFFTKPLSKSNLAPPPPPQTSQAMVDIFAYEDKAKVKPSRIGKKPSVDKTPVTLDLLSDHDVNMFPPPKSQLNDDDFFGSLKPSTTKPKLGGVSLGNNSLPKTTSAADDDFFATLMTAPKRKS